MPQNLGCLSHDSSPKVLLLVGEVCLYLKVFSSNGDVCVFISFRETKKKREEVEGIGDQGVQILLCGMCSSRWTEIYSLYF